MYFIFDIISLFLYLYNIPFIILFLFNDYIRDKDYRMYYIIIDMIFIFIMCFWVGLWDQGFIGSLFVFIRIYDSMLFPFYVWFLGIPLLYKDNDPYVVIGIYFHFCLLFLGSMIISGILFIYYFYDDFYLSLTYDNPFFVCFGL